MDAPRMEMNKFIKNSDRERIDFRGVPQVANKALGEARYESK